MAEQNQPGDMLDYNTGQKQPLPGMLNVLTILTFIGCALAFIGGIWNYVRADKAYKDILDAQDKLDQMPGWAKKMIGPDMVEMARKSVEYKLPILLLTLIGAGLCLYGALEMRKLKKQGFILWVAGEFAPIVASYIFLGSGMFSGFAMLMFLFPVLFLVLYASQRKYLVH